MRRTKPNCDRFQWADLSKLAAVAILLAVCLPTRSMAQQPGQKTFSSPEGASNALVTAAQSRRETKPRTPKAALISCRDISKCTVW